MIIFEEFPFRSNSITSSIVEFYLTESFKDEVTVKVSIVI